MIQSLCQILSSGLQGVREDQTMAALRSFGIIRPPENYSGMCPKYRQTAPKSGAARKNMAAYDLAVPLKSPHFAPTYPAKGGARHDLTPKIHHPR